MKKRERQADVGRTCRHTTCPACGFKLVPTCSGDVESKCPRCGERY